MLIVFFWGIYGLYYYFFVLNKWNLTLHANVDNYKVEMYAEEIKTSFSSDCKQKTCELIELAPFSYTVTISKEWYKPYTQDITVKTKQTLEMDFTLEKQLQVTKIMSNVSESSQEKLDKFREINQLQKSYKFFNLKNLGYFYFTDNNDNTLSLLHKTDEKENKIYSFAKVWKNKIDISEVFQTENEVGIMYDTSVYIYQIDSGNIIEIFFPQELSYIKKTLTWYQLINKKWSFLYDINSKQVEYFYTFKDFIDYDADHYFGIIFKDEKEKKQNYNLANDDDNLIVKYNFKTKNIKVLETISENISKIVQENGQIYFYNESGDKFLVNNIE